jgi:hypothetical protein
MGVNMLEFVISLAVFLAVLQVLLAAEGDVAKKASEQLNETKLKMEAEEIAASANTLYLNWGNIEVKKRFGTASVTAEGDTITLGEGNMSASARCLSPEVSKADAIIVEGVRRWFPLGLFFPST